MLFIGLFSFSIDLELFGGLHKLAFFPLGLFLFFLFTRKNHTRWHKYKPFLWIGFCVNYAFFVVGIAIIPIINALYPANDLHTYIKSLDDAQVIRSHMSADEQIKLSEDAWTTLQKSEQADIHADEWYINYSETQHSYTEEAFPYMLSNVTIPFGMDKTVHFFVEQDGKGLLIMTEDVQTYFRTKEPFLTFGGDSDA